MQAANFNSAACSCACCSGDETPPSGRRFRQEFRAAVKRGESESGIEVISPPLVTFGSGKSGTPCARMHAENAIGLSDSESPASDGWVVVVLDGSWATPGLSESPPQPAAISATLARAASAKLTTTRRGGPWGGERSFSKIRIASRDSARAVTGGEQELLPACNRVCGIL